MKKKKKKNYYKIIKKKNLKPLTFLSRVWLWIIYSDYRIVVIFFFPEISFGAILFVLSFGGWECVIILTVGPVNKVDQSSPNQTLILRCNSVTLGEPHYY